MIALLLIWNAAAHKIVPPRKTWFARICSALIAEDTTPFAENSNGELLELYRYTRVDRDKVLKEAVFRLRAGMFDASEEAEFWVITNSRKAKP